MVAVCLSGALPQSGGVGASLVQNGTKRSRFNFAAGKIRVRLYVELSRSKAGIKLQNVLLSISLRKRQGSPRCTFPESRGPLIHLFDVALE